MSLREKVAYAICSGGGTDCNCTCAHREHQCQWSHEWLNEADAAIRAVLDALARYAEETRDESLTDAVFAFRVMHEPDDALESKAAAKYFIRKAE